MSYVAFQFVLKQQALDLGREHAIAQRLPANVQVSAQPRPPTPFNWTVFVSDEEAQRYAHVNLVRKQPRRYAPGASRQAPCRNGMPSRPGVRKRRSANHTHWPPSLAPS